MRNNKFVLFSHATFYYVYKIKMKEGEVADGGCLAWMIVAASFMVRFLLVNRDNHRITLSYLIKPVHLMV